MAGLCAVYACNQWQRAWHARRATLSERFFFSDLVSFFAALIHQRLGVFVRRATLSERFFFSDFEPMLRLALMLRHLPLSLREAYIYAISPADPDDAPVASALLSFASAYASKCVRLPWAHPKLDIPHSLAVHCCVRSVWSKLLRPSCTCCGRPAVAAAVLRLHISSMPFSYHHCFQRAADPPGMLTL